MLGISLTALMIGLITFWFQFIDKIKPHGTIATILALFGIVLPLFGIISNEKMKKYAKVLILTNTPAFIRGIQIHPQ
jgi:hypothetical protein